jgi:DNA-binding transcriptional LysR family regulator
MADIRGLRHLIAVAEHGHFGKAGRAERISQPALTKSIQRLEKDLGVKLLDRSRKRVRPTGVGQVVIERARVVLSGVTELRREVDLLAGREIGELTVGVGPAMAESFVTLAIARLAEKRPLARIVVRVDHWGQLSEWLNDERIDLYVADTAHSRRDRRVEVVPTPPEYLVWFCSEHHPLAATRSVTRKQLLQYPLVTPRMPDWARRWFAQVVDPKQELDPARRYSTVECENYTMLKRMVLAGNCLSAALRSTIADELAQGTLVELRVKAPKLRTNAGIVYLRDRTLSPLAEALIEELLRAAQDVLTAAGPS